jgi:enoyl-CoA hydratase
MHVILDRPPVNAVNEDGLRLIRDTFNAVNGMKDVSAIVVSSSNPQVFSAGADFKMLGGDEPIDSFLARESMFAIYECPVPVIVAARGAAIGSGAGLLGLADLVIGGPGTRLSHPAVDRGAVGGTKFLSRLLGEQLTRKILITGCIVTGEEMRAVGAFADYVPDDEILDVALGYGETAAWKHPRVIRFLKQSFIETERLGVRDGYRLEQKYMAPLDDLRAELVPGGGKEGLVKSRRVPTELVHGRLQPSG